MSHYGLSSCFALDYPGYNIYCTCCHGFCILYTKWLGIWEGFWRKCFTKSQVQCAIPWQAIEIRTKWGRFKKGEKLLIIHLSGSVKHHFLSKNKKKPNVKTIRSKKDWFFKQWHIYHIRILSFSQLISKSFQREKCWCECKTRLLWIILSAPTAL